MSPDREAFEDFMREKYPALCMSVRWHEEEQRYTVLSPIQDFWVIWQACSASIKDRYTLCEKEPRRYIQELASTPLYREAK